MGIYLAGQSDGLFMLENMRNTAYLASKARKKGITFMVEAVAWGSQVTLEKQNDPENIAKVCRIALECGADVIKTTYTGDPKSFKEITSSIPIPIVVLGGELQNIFQGVRDALDSGAKGVAFGRNVFQHENPSMIVNALKGIVHNSVSVKEALAKMK